MSPKGQTPIQTDTVLRSLPRPLYGHVDTLPNRVLAYRHKHPWHQLAYAAAGVLQVRTSTAWLTAPPQRAVWIPAGVVHRVHCQHDTEVRSLYMRQPIPAMHADACRVLVVSNLLRELILAFSRVPVAYNEDGADGRLAAVLFDQLCAAADAGLDLPLPRDPRLQPICRQLQAHPDSQDNLHDWSARSGVSSKTLSRLFVRETGLTFRAWRQRLRLLGALPALQRGDAVTEVALVQGYDSVSAFIAAFKRQFGASPTAYFAPGAREDSRQAADTPATPTR